METYNIKLGSTASQLKDVLDLTNIVDENVYSFVDHYNNLDNFILAYASNDDASIQIITLVKRVDVSCYNRCEIYEDGILKEAEQFDYVAEARACHSDMVTKYIG